MRGEELSACYSGLMQRVLTAPRFAKTEHGGDDDLEVKDCVLDVLLAVVESTWPSVTRVRSPDLMVCFSLLLFIAFLFLSLCIFLFFAFLSFVSWQYCLFLSPFLGMAY